MAILNVEVVVRAIDVCWHHRREVATVLIVIPANDQFVELAGFVMA